MKHFIQAGQNKKAAQAEVNKLFFRAYKEVKAHLDLFGPFPPERFRGTEINSGEAKDLAAQFRHGDMDALLDTTAGTGLFKTGLSGGFAHLKKASRLMANFTRLSAMSSALLKQGRRPYIAALLEAYKGLFKQ